MSDGFTRRDVLRLTVLGGVVAAAEGCGIAPPERRRPVPGPEAEVRTVCGVCPAGCGLAVRTVGGNAVGLAGIADHPVNGGGLCPRGAAEIQELYHPDRLTGPLARSGSSFTQVSWDAATARLAHLGGAGLVIGIGALTAVERHLVGLLAAKLDAPIVRVAPAAPSGGGGFSVDLARADLVLSLGADWLQEWASPPEAQRGFAAQRTATPRARLWTASPRLSITAARSDRWLPVRRDLLGRLGLGLAAHLLAHADAATAGRNHELAAALAAPGLGLAPLALELGLPAGRLEELADELGSRHRPVVVAAPELGPVALLLNTLLGALGREGGLMPERSPLATELEAPAARELAAPGAARAILLVRANPLYLAPVSPWATALAKAELVVSLASQLDESALAAHLVLPLASALETRQLSWGMTADGATLVSAGPAAVAPLGETREPAALLLDVARAAGAALPWPSADAYHDALATALGAHDLLASGGFVRPAAAPAAAAPDPISGLLPGLAAHLAVDPIPAGELALELVWPLAFAGGAGAHLPFLHGIAGPGGRELWDTTIELHPQTAAQHGLSTGARVAVESAHGSITARAELREGIRPDTVAIAVGLGRRALGRWATGGANPLELGASTVRIRRQS